MKNTTSMTMHILCICNLLLILLSLVLIKIINYTNSELKDEALKLEFSIKRQEERAKRLETVLSEAQEYVDEVKQFNLSREDIERIIEVLKYASKEYYMEKEENQYED